MKTSIISATIANLSGLATAGLFAGSLVCLVISNGDMAKKLAIGGVGTGVVTGASAFMFARGLKKGVTQGFDALSKFAEQEEKRNG